MARYLLKLLLLAPGGVVSWIPALSAHPAVITTTTMRAVGSSSPQHGPRSDPLASSTSSSSSSSSRSEVLRELGRYAAGAGVLSLAGACGSPLPALADNALAATKKSYFRYVPRILDAMAWYEGDLQKAIAEEDWPKVLAYFEVINTARSDSSRPAMYQSSSSRMQRELFSPLSVWAQSMSIKGTGRLRALLSQEEKLEQAMASLEKAASGKSLKEGESQGQAAKAAWEAGRDAIQEYVEVANKGMVRSLRKIDTPFST
ncbi:unnamed protein product [Ectocarpus sp. 8 AP-2014]